MANEIAQAITLEVIHRASTSPGGNPGSRALEIGGDAGTPTLKLSRYFEFEKILGLDMPEGDSTNAFDRLKEFPDNAHELTVLTGGSRHLEKIERVLEILMAMDRITSPQGLVLFMDSVQPMSRKQLRRALPSGTRRIWCHFASLGWPGIQFILGLPVRHDRPFVRKGLPWQANQNPVPERLRPAWKFARLSTFNGIVTDEPRGLTWELLLPPLG